MPDSHDNYPQVTPTEMQIATHLTELNIMDIPNISPNNPNILTGAGLIVKESGTSTTAESSISSIVTNFLSAICSLPDPATLQDCSCHICLNNFSTSSEQPIQLPCGHIFGLSCLVTWTQEKLYTNCPMCRIQYLDPHKSLEACLKASKPHSTCDSISKMLEAMIRRFPVEEVLEYPHLMPEFDYLAGQFYGMIGQIQRKINMRTEEAQGDLAEDAVDCGKVDGQ
ncbi:MAG: hypothetical protein Q9205_007785 [Flavoplaca limonia]